MNKLCKKRTLFHLEDRIPKQPNPAFIVKSFMVICRNFQPITQKYMKIPILIPNNIVTIGYFYGQANVV